MKITEKYYISGRGVVLVGRVEEGERWPVCGPARFTYPDGSSRSVDVGSVETTLKLMSPPIRSNVVGCVITNAAIQEPFEGGELSFDRRVADRRVKDRRA